MRERLHAPPTPEDDRREQWRALLLGIPHLPGAACASGDYPADLWFASSTGQAAEVCRGCPVRDDCGEWAQDHDERWGVWVGEAR
jgi:hypothetical protein